MTKTIAITGKGGVGKTTTSALLIGELMRAGVRPVLAIDGDPNNTLGAALGIEAESVLADIRDEVKDKTPQGVSKPQYAAQQFQECITESEGFDLLTMGRPEGPGCYCYVNNLLRDSIQKLRRNYRAIVIDNAAGMEHISRLVTDDIDELDHRLRSDGDQRGDGRADQPARRFAALSRGPETSHIESRPRRRGPA